MKGIVFIVVHVNIYNILNIKAFLLLVHLGISVDY